MFPLVNGLYVSGGVGIGTITPNARLHVNTTGSEDAFRVQLNGQTRFYVHSGGGVAIGANNVPPPNGLYVSGKVGIGIITPTHTLEVVGNAAISNGLTSSEGGISSSSTSGDGVSGSSNTTYGNGVSGRVVIKAMGFMEQALMGFMALDITMEFQEAVTMKRVPALLAQDLLVLRVTVLSME